MKKTKVTKTKMHKKTSPVWLIILLCAIIVGLFWLVNYSKRIKLENFYDQEVQKLNQELEQIKREKDIEVKKLEEKLFLSSPASPSASLKATSSANLEPKVATNSLERQ